MFGNLLNAFNINVQVGTDVMYEEKFQQIKAMMESGGAWDNNINAINTTFTCRKILCETVSKLPLLITKNGKPYKKHRLWNLVNHKPCPWMTTDVWLSTMINHLASYGNAFAECKKENGTPVSLPIINPSYLSGYKLNEKGVLIFNFKNIENTLNVSNETFKADFEVNYDSLVHPMILSDNGITGLNPIAAINKQLSINWQGNTVMDNYYRHGLHSNKVIESVDGVTSREWIDGQTAWNQSSNVFKAGEIRSLPFGTRLHELKLEFADAQILPTIKYNTGQIAAMYGILGFMLGVEEMKYKSINEALVAFKVQTIQPLTKMFAMSLTDTLLTETEIKNGVAIEFDLTAMIDADFITKANYYKTLIQGKIINPNTAAIALGFDEYEGGQYHYGQAQDQPMELVAANGEWKPITNGTTLNLNTNQ